jgi:hypothetical protein
MLSGPRRAHARALAAELDAPSWCEDLHGRPCAVASADRLVRVLSQLLGLPPPPPEPGEQRSSLSRTLGGRARHPTERTPAAAGQHPRACAGCPVHITADPPPTRHLSAGPRDWACSPGPRPADVARRQVLVEAIILEAIATDPRGRHRTGAGHRARHRSRPGRSRPGRPRRPDVAAVDPGRDERTHGDAAIGGGA